MNKQVRLNSSQMSWSAMKLTDEGKLVSLDGLTIAISIFRNLEESFKKKLIQDLTIKSPALAKLALECEFLYKDLPRLQNKSFEQVLNRIDRKVWLYAWKLTSPALKHDILSHMSQRRQLDFLEAVKTLPAIPKANALKAQTYIAKTILAGLRSGAFQLKKLG